MRNYRSRHAEHYPSPPPSWSASTVLDQPSMPPCGPSTKRSVAISRFGLSTPSTRTLHRHGSSRRSTRPGRRRDSCPLRVHGRRIHGQARQDRGRDLAGPTDAARCSRLPDRPPCSASARWVSGTAPKAASAQPRRRWRHPPIALWPSSGDTTRCRRNTVGGRRSRRSAASDGVLARAGRGAAARGAPCAC